MPPFTNLVAGQPVASATHFDSFSPSTGQAIAQIPHSSAEQVNAAVAAARAAQPAWAALQDAERAAALNRVADVLHANAEHLATWIAREQGKPLGGVGPTAVPGARFEAWACEAWTRATAALSLPVDVVFEDDTRRDELHRRPLGVVAAIAPWNWPVMIAIWQVIPALRAGNTVVLKPSEYTSACTLEMVHLIAEVLPPGVVNTVTGAGEVGALLAGHPDINKITFTGSGPTGQKIAKIAAERLIPVTLELGGNDAALVLPDADPDAVAMGLFWGAFLNMGQTCACIKRLYLPDALHDAIVTRLKALAEAIPVGDPLAEATVMGPVQNRMQLGKVTRLVEEARAAGGQVLCGGVPADGPGNFYPLTLVTGLKDGDSLVDEEQFGPVLPILRYASVEAAIASANRLDLGLGASVWGQDAAELRRVAECLEAGSVWVNQHGMVHPMVPFGGIKGSGQGVEFGVEGLKAMTRAQVISFKKG